MKSSIAFSMTAEVLRQVQSTIGSLPAECGGMLGGCRQSGLVSHYYFDGTAGRTTATYSPDVASVNRVLAADWNPRGVDLMGFVHSHPSGSMVLSGGDREYARAILDANPGLGRLLLPIVQSRCDANDFEMKAYVASTQPGDVNVQPVTIDVVDDKEDAGASMFGSLPMFARVGTAYDLRRMERSRIIAVGCGGSASFLEDLARAGLGEFVLIDPDVVGETNLATQQTYRHDFGRTKVAAIGTRIRQINPLACVVEYADALESLSDMDVSFVATTCLRDRLPAMTLLCGMTDNFFAQARVNRLALNFGLPSLCAQVYAEGHGAEITFTHPDVTPACHRCILASRYTAYLEQGFQNTVGSQGTPFVATAALNALKQLIALAILHHGTDHPRFGPLLRRIGSRNLVQMRLDPDAGLPAFAGLDASGDSFFCNDVLWIPRPAQKQPACPDCGGRGDLRVQVGRLSDTRPMRSCRTVTAGRG
jgi:proteasome lid subunit RPN8/RPN11